MTELSTPETNTPAAEQSAEEVARLEIGGASPAELSMLMEAGAELPKAEAAGDDLAKREEALFESSRKRAELRSFNQDVDQRKRFANRIFCLIAGWLFGIFVVLLLSGFFSERVTITCQWEEQTWVITPQFKLSDTVVLALIGGTTVNVLGILILVVQYLFPKKGG